MPVIKLRSHIGEDGMLHLDILPEFKGQEVDVTVTVEPITEEKTKTKETLSQARERFAKVREHFQGRNFLDSTELLREDRQR
ncbi:MAG: hypothetical protein IM473_17625 [Microcystis sp. M015S2]|jgi:hypothetical protein|uniref:hypothetical protein n=1 Tax=unclassified Microcystis TaxID=2643300 RepID=UPI00258ABC92|nr:MULTISPECIES: hypothetical protein [unclassified Microcystis]MCA2711908.1 hypothetical protein [Microcystis sp. M025S2]MCA2744155.1 hypothetical protein [Microcystis sp. M015S2]MCA2760559.1 hypothetical protein [Microcystis sp. M145S2]